VTTIAMSARAKSHSRKVTHHEVTIIAMSARAKSSAPARAQRACVRIDDPPERSEWR
jgi:hypothetical protein